MPPNLKRNLSVTDRSVSPPELRKKSKIDPEGIKAVDTAFNLLCIYSWNVNGVGPLLQKRISFEANSTFPIRSFLKRHSWPSLLCLQEVKISAKDATTQDRFRQAVNAGCLPGEPVYTTEFSLPRDKYNATGFGGKVHGVATLIRDDLKTTLHTWKPDWDLEGRVLVHELTDLKLTVVNGYWVNGTSNPYRNSDTGIEEGTRHDHKLRFHKNMLELAREVTLQKHQHVVLIGDMNVARSRIDGHPNLRTSPVQHVKNRADFNSKFFTHEDGLQGVDVFRALHGQEKKYTYYPRGRPWGASCDRVDLIITDQNLLTFGAVRGSDICDNPQDRGHSDHVPLWIAIDTQVLQSDERSTKPGIQDSDPP